MNKEIRYFSSKELEEIRREEMNKSIISINDNWGNKKDYKLENGILYISEEKEKEFEEIGLIKSEEREYKNQNGEIIKEKRKYIKNGDNKISYRIDEKKGKKEFQFHQMKKSSFKILSDKIDDINYRMILFPKKDFNRIEIWKFPKGKREMIYRNDKEDYKEISKEWKKISGKEIDIEKEIEKII